MANQMNLMSFRDTHEHDIINLYSTMEGNINKGTLVEFQPGTADFDNQNSFGLQLSNTPQYAYSADYGVNWKVRAASSGSTTVLGVLLKDTVTNILDPWTVDARFVDPAKLSEKQVVPSGRAVPVLKRGILTVTGLDTASGAPGPGSGIAVSSSGGGLMAVVHPNNNYKIGHCLTSSGANSAGVVVWINIP